MKKRPLTLVGAFLLLAVAIVVAVSNFKKPQTKIEHQPLALQQSVRQHMPKPHVQPKTPNKQSGTFVITTKATMGPQQNTEQ